jgi:hypothetical protein
MKKEENFFLKQVGHEDIEKDGYTVSTKNILFLPSLKTKISNLKKKYRHTLGFNKKFSNRMNCLFLPIISGVCVI